MLIALTLFSSSFINSSESNGELFFSSAAEINRLPKSKKEKIKATRIAVLSIKKANRVDINISVEYIILIKLFALLYIIWKVTNVFSSLSIILPKSLVDISLVTRVVGGFDANYKGTYYRMSLLYSAVNIAVKGETVTCGGITGILNSRNSKPTDSYVTDIV